MMKKDMVPSFMTMELEMDHKEELTKVSMRRLTVFKPEAKEETDTKTNLV